MRTLPPVLEKYGGLTRFILYLILSVWSAALFAFCVVRLVYTETPRNEPSLNGGQPFYDPVVVELIASAFLGECFSLLVLRQLWYRQEQELFTKPWFEIGCLSTLWLLWLGGAAASTTTWPNLQWCIQYQPCVMLQLLLAWAWLGWITLTFLLIPTIWLVSAQRNWGGQNFDTWGHRTFHGDYMYNGNGGGVFKDKEAGIGGFGFSRQASRISGMAMPFGMGKRFSNMDVLNITRPASANNPKIQVAVRKDVESHPPAPPPAFTARNLPNVPTAANRPIVSISSRASPASNSSPVSNRSRSPPEAPIGRSPINLPNSPNMSSPLNPTPPLNLSRSSPASSSGQPPIAPPKNSVLRGKGRVHGPGSVDISEPKPVSQGTRNGGYF